MNTETKIQNNESLDSHSLVSPLCGENQIVSETTIHFSAQTPAGAVVVSISDHGLELASLSPLRSRLELSRIEQLLRNLEDWLGISLDFEPVSDQPESPLVFKVCGGGKSPRNIAVYIPVECWQYVAQSTDVLNADSYSIEWPEYYAKLVLGSFSLSDEDFNAIQDNATILLPQSFQPKWGPILFVPAFNSYLEGNMVGTELTWETENCSSVLAESDTNYSGKDSEEVICFCSLSAKHFFSGGQSGLSELVTSQLREHGGVLRCGDIVQATGTLIPIGKGMGLHISRVTGSNS